MNLEAWGLQLVHNYMHLLKSHVMPCQPAHELDRIPAWKTTRRLNTDSAYDYTDLEELAGREEFLMPTPFFLITHPVDVGIKGLVILHEGLKLVAMLLDVRHDSVPVVRVLVRLPCGPYERTNSTMNETFKRTLYSAVRDLPSSWSAKLRNKQFPSGVVSLIRQPKAAICSSYCRSCAAPNLAPLF